MSVVLQRRSRVPMYFIFLQGTESRKGLTAEHNLRFEAMRKRSLVGSGAAAERNLCLLSTFLPVAVLLQALAMNHTYSNRGSEQTRIASMSQYSGTNKPTR